MTIDDYYYQESTSGTTHLARTNAGPALCGYAFTGRGTLALDTGIDEDAVCSNCAARVR